MSKPLTFNYSNYEACQAENASLKELLDAAIHDLSLTADCATCYMRGKKGYSSCKPTLDKNYSCTSYKWHGLKEEGKE